ncbi:MAG: ATP-binding protein [Thermodesulfovibrionales bacterium]|jgi:two-component system phosphate regulon sensor histidine kinase PhoR
MTLLIIALLSIALILLAIRLVRLSLVIRELRSVVHSVSQGTLGAHPFADKTGGVSEIARGISSVMEKTWKRLEFAEAEMQRMEAILRGMSDGVLITDLRGVVILANQAFKLLLSVGDAMEGKRILEVLRNVQLADLFQHAMDTGDITSGEVIVSRQQRELYLVATAIPVYAGKAVSGIVLTLHDITRLRQLEEVRKDFVANVSHEIKTPLTAIKGFAETLLDGAVDDRENALRFLGMIRNHSERLNSLVDDLLHLSRIELGDITIEKIEVKVDQVVETVFMTLRGKAETKRLYLKKEIPDPATTIPADRDRLIQIILNLVDNGIKFTEKGGVTVGIDEAGGRITLYVQDTGPGIPENHIHRLGERFYRVDRARSRELGGTGLGLAIVKHLVSTQGWSMRIESEQGKGTRVNIVIDRYL